MPGARRVVTEIAPHKAIEAGYFLLAGAFTLTRRLWLSIGFRLACNHTQSAWRRPTLTRPCNRTEGTMQP